MKHRGQSALDYLIFQKILLLISLITVVISVLAAFINFFAPNPQFQVEDYQSGALNNKTMWTFFVDSTTIGNLAVGLNTCLLN